jgi:alpha-L-fucosidase
LNIKSLGTGETYRQQPIKTVTLLGYDGQLHWEQQVDSLAITCPAKMPFETSVVFKIE